MVANSWSTPDSKTFQRGEKNAAESVADGRAVSRLKRPEFETADGVCAFEHYHLVRFLKCQDCHINSFWVLLLLRVQIDDELFVDVFRDVRPCREIQELA